MIQIHDDILPKEQLLAVRQSALESGFGTWQPASNSFGYSSYRGMNWKGHHGTMHAALTRLVKTPIYPNSSFFRVASADEDKALIHSDRNDGNYTAIAYMSEDDDVVHGTAFYVHKSTGLREMPPMQEMIASGEHERWMEDMKDYDKWEQLDFVRGLFGRMLIFSAPLFHKRVPDYGFGNNPENSRMIWVSHFLV